MAVPDPTQVAPWYLRNINQALELDQATGNVFIRTNAAIVGNVSVGNVAIGSLGNIDLSHTYMPVSVTGNITGITSLPPITGNVGITGNANIAGNVGIIGNVNVTQGTTPWSVAGNVTVSSGNITTTVDPAEKTAFQEPLAIAITPVIQADSLYGLDPDVWSTTQLNSGNVATTNVSTWQVNSGTSAGGYARLATNKYMTYQPGQGSMFRWTAAFTANATNKNGLGVANIVQNTGPIDRENGYSVGYSGSTSTADSNRAQKIGFLHRNNGRAEIRTLTITQQNTGAQTATITLNGTAFTVSLVTSSSTAYCAAQIAALLKAQATPNNLWDIDACGSTVTFTYYTPGSQNGTYSLSSTGTGTLAAGTFARTQTGAGATDTWTYVDQWDNQSVDFDPTKLNVWAIDFRWLGAGIVRLFMEDPATGQMTLMHTQTWTNANGNNPAPHIVNPSLRLIYRSGTTNPAVTPSQNVVVTGASVMSGVQGIITQTSTSQSWFNLDGATRAKDSLWHLLSIQNPFVRNNGVNKSSLILEELTVAVKSTDPCVIYVVKNATGTSDYLVFNPVTGATAFQFAQYSVSAVTETFTGADIPALVTTLGINGSSQFNLLSYSLALAPGETISVFISSTSSINSTSVGLTWKVD
jgi:hypothetical protein